MIESDKFGHSIDGAKCVSVKSGHGTQALITFVRLDGQLNDAASDRGYRSRYDFIILADAGHENCYTDRHEMARDSRAVDKHDAIYELVRKVSDGDVGYEELDDGHVYTPEEVENM